MFWRLNRPLDWVQYLGLVLLGWSFVPASELPVLPFAWAALYLAACFSFNSACDAEFDSPGKNPLSPESHRSDDLRLWRAGTGAALLCCAPLALGMVPDHPWIAASQPLIGFLYSLPKNGLKRFPVLGVVSNVWLFIPLVWVGYPGLAGDIGWAFTLLAVPMAESQLIHEWIDRDEDARASTRTTARWLGARHMKWLLRGLDLIVLASAYLCFAAGRLALAPAVAFAVAAAVSFWQLDSWVKHRLVHRVAYLAACLAWLAANFGVLP